MNVFTLVQRALAVFCIAFCIQGHTAEKETLVNYTYMGQFDREEARRALEHIPPLDRIKLRHSLSLYRVHYKTPAPDGSMTIASGLVAMPIAPKAAVGIVSYLHGTRVLRSDVPSNNNVRNLIYLATFGNSGGYMTVMPDYLGLGDNDLKLHPYVQADTIASSSIDMLTAAKEMANRINYPINEKLYLAGYSEGGFSTMVMFEALAKNNYPVTAAAPGSAPYDWQETMQFITQKPGPRATAYLAYFFYSMQTYRHYWSSLDELFVQPYNILIPSLFDGTHQMPEIIQQLPHDPRDIFHAVVYNALIDGTEKNTKALIENFNHYDFTPNAPLMLISTKGDKDLPFKGAKLAYRILKTKSDTVYLKQVSPDLDHIRALPFVLKEQLDFFNSLG